MLLDLHKLGVLILVVIFVIIIGVSKSFGQIEVLLHLYMDLLGLLLILIDYFSQAFVVSFLLFLLCLLGAEGYAYIAIVVDCFLQVLRLRAHFLLFFVNPTSEVAFVPICAYLLFLSASIVRKKIQASYLPAGLGCAGYFRISSDCLRSSRFLCEDCLVAGSAIRKGYVRVGVRTYLGLGRLSFFPCRHIVRHFDQNR